MTDEAGRAQFYELLRGRQGPVYVAFDIVWLNGVDLRPLPLTSAGVSWGRARYGFGRGMPLPKIFAFARKPGSREQAAQSTHQSLSRLVGQECDPF